MLGTGGVVVMDKIHSQRSLCVREGNELLTNGKTHKHVIFKIPKFKFKKKNPNFLIRL